eukprot:767660-Hanusia_phi.AAC.5
MLDETDSFFSLSCSSARPLFSTQFNLLSNGVDAIGQLEELHPSPQAPHSLSELVPQDGDVWIGNASTWHSPRDGMRCFLIAARLSNDSRFAHDAGVAMRFIGQDSLAAGYALHSAEGYLSYERSQRSCLLNSASLLSELQKGKVRSTPRSVLGIDGVDILTSSDQPLGGLDGASVPAADEQGGEVVRKKDDGGDAGMLVCSWVDVQHDRDCRAATSRLPCRP